MTDIETAYSQIWRKYDSANVVEIHYKARSKNDDNTR